MCYSGQILLQSALNYYALYVLIAPSCILISLIYDLEIPSLRYLI